MNNKICSKLLETYDSRYLDTLDNQTKQIWNDTTRKILSSKNPFIKKNSNLVISRLVQNHFNKNKPTTDLLSGPMSFTLQKSEKYNMNIYIFGEYHGLEDDCKQFLKNKECKKPCKKTEICNPKSGRCVSKKGKIGKTIKVNKKDITEMEIQEYFKKLLDNTDVFLDLYVEVPQFLNKKYNSRYKLLGSYTYLSKIYNSFRNCIQTKTRENNKNCELFRFHYIDIRKKDNLSPDLVIENFIKDLDNSIISESSKKFLEILTDINKKLLLEIYESDIENNNYIQKELSKTPLKNQILEYCKEIAKTQIDYFDINLIKKNANILLKKGYDKNFTYNLRNILITLGALAVDVYTLSRLFRTEFRISKFQPKKQHNIIMYAGDAHSTVYRGFLKSLDFDLLYKSGSVENKKSNRCVELKSEYQPLFE